MTTATVPAEPEAMTDDEVAAVLSNPDAPDPEAPYGRTMTGRPKKSPAGRPPGSGKKPTGKRRATRPRTTTRRPASTARKGTDYRKALLGVASMVSMALRRFSPLDAVTVEIMAPEGAEIVNEIAQESAQLAALLDRLTIVGPFGKVATFATKFAAQIALNHGKVPEPLALSVGAMPRAELLAYAERMLGQAEAAMAAAAAQSEQQTAAA